MPAMKRLLALSLAAACGSAYGYASDTQDTYVVKVLLQPGKVHEECMKVDAGAKRRYHWKADAPVDFNIHYHSGKDVFYPVKRDRMRGDGGTFTAKTSEEYCWMWTAKEKPAKVEGGIEPSR